MPLIQARKVHKAYLDGKVEVHALNGVDLDIGEGEFAALAGPSGSGKTTLLNLISGLDTPTSGELFLDGQNLAELGSGALTDYRLHKIGFIFQSYNLIPVLTALENVAFTLMLQGVDAAARQQRARDMLGEVGLADIAHRRPSALSGGQQQRVAVARAMVTRPRIVLADEPTANLDSVNARKLLDLMANMNARAQTTFLFSTHDPMVMEFSRRLIRLKDGHIESDTSEE